MANGAYPDLQPGSRATLPWRNLALFLLTGTGIVYSLLFTHVLLFSVVGAIALAVVSQPFAVRVEKHLSPTWTATVCVLLVTLALLLPLFFIVRNLVGEAISLVQFIQNGSAEDMLNRIAQDHPTIGGHVRQAAQEIDLAGMARRLAGSAAHPIGVFFSSVANGLTDAVLLLFFYFFLIRDRTSATNALAAIIPLQDADTHDLLHQTGDVVQAIFAGRFVIALIQGALAGLAYLLLGVPGALLWSALTVICCLVPAFGSFVAWVPIALYLGLAQSLLVGISFAKSLSFGLGKPLIAVNHLEGHIHAALMQGSADENAPVSGFAIANENTTSSDAPVTTSEAQPTLALVVSGGHTHLYLASQQNKTWQYRNIGRTVDDAAGEAYDKVAKLLGLPYPGGPWIDRLSSFGNPEAVRFHFSTIDRGTAEHPTFDFSFSGIKTAVLRYVETHNLRAAADARHTALSALAACVPEAKSDAPRPTLDDARALCDAQTLDLISSFQHAVVSNLVRQTLRAAEHTGARYLIVSGGVASNRALRARFIEAAQQRGLTVAFPPPALSTDNAAMIAAAAWPRLLANDFAASNLNATPQLRLG